MTGGICAWLGELGLRRYAQAFLDQDIDAQSLPHLTEADLRELGISMGHRKILLAAIDLLPKTRSQPHTDPPVLADDPHKTPVPDPGQPAERRFVTVLFCDMMGSTRLARQLDPEDMRQLLRDYQDRVAGAVARYGGHLAQYLGDGVMAFFGWPTAFEDQAERAVRAGLEAIEMIGALPTRDAGPIRGRIAIASGYVVVGDLSGAGRQEGAIAGETPNLAARLQQCADPDQVVISAGTRDLVAEAFDVSELPARTLAGFDQEIRLYRVDGVRNMASRFDATRGPNLSRFVGRQPELDSVMEKWDAAKAGEGQAVLIVGEAGIGKSHFARVIANEIAKGEHARWQVQCSPYHTSSALFPLLEALSRALGTQPDGNPDSRLDRLETMLQEANMEIPVIAPLLAELLSLNTMGRHEIPDLPARERKALTLTALVDLWLAMGGTAPLLLMIEDVHWGDPTTREVIERTAARIAKARVLMLITHRPDWMPDWQGQYNNVSIIALGRLSRFQVAELVRDLVGPDADESLIETIAARTDGVPMFVEEVARSLAEVGAGYDPRELPVPATLQGALTSRLDALPPSSREVIQAASVMGREFNLDVISRACGLTDIEMEASLDQMIRMRLVMRTGLTSDTVSFRHALIQEATYQTLLRSKRRHLHQAIAAELARTWPLIAETRPELLARHLTEAGLPHEALPLWRHAGDRALSRYDNDEAVLHFEKALEVARQLPIMDVRGGEVLASQLSLAQALMAASMLPGSMAAFQHASDLARSRDDIPALVTAALGFDKAEFSTNAPIPTSIPLLTDALGRLDGTQDSLDVCHLMCRLTRAYIMSGQSEKAAAYGQQTAAMARRVRDDHSLAEVLIHQFLVPKPGYDPTQRSIIEKRLAEILEIAARIGDLDLHGRAIATNFSQWAEIGDRDQMDATLDLWSQWSESRKYVLVQWLVRHARAMMAILEGDWEMAEAFAWEAMELGRRSHGDQAEGVHGIQMFTIRREQGRLGEVAPIIKRLIDDEPDNAAWRPGFALIACDLGFDAPARRMLDELARNGFSLPLDAKRSTSLAYLAEACAALNEQSHAEALYHLLAPYRHMTITSGVAIVCHGSARRYLGLLADTLGAWDDAASHFEDALQFNRRMRSPPWLAHTQCDFARMLRRRGRSADIRHAALLIDESRTTARRLGMTALQDRLDCLQD
jgi:class 3 adenylate cyclase/tetratricopeptide (TPR) repeat protein